MANWRKISYRDGILTEIDMDTGTIRTKGMSFADEIAKADRNFHSENRFIKKKTQDHMHKIADIPENVYWHLWQTGIAQDRERFAHWLLSDAAAPYRSDMRDFGSAMSGNRRMI